LLSLLFLEGIDFDKLSRYLGNYLKREEIVEEGFEELVYKKEVKEKKKKMIVTKKIGKKHAKYKKPKKTQENKGHKESLTVNTTEILDKVDINSSGGADTLDTHVEKKTEIEKKKEKTTVWLKPERRVVPLD
jgi:hypothetical protein